MTMRPMEQTIVQLLVRVGRSGSSEVALIFLSVLPRKDVSPDLAPCLMRQVAGVSLGRSLNPIVISAATFAVIGRHSNRQQANAERPDHARSSRILAKLDTEGIAMSDDKEREQALKDLNPIEDLKGAVRYLKEFAADDLKDFAETATEVLEPHESDIRDVEPEPDEPGDPPAVR